MRRGLILECYFLGVLSAAICKRLRASIAIKLKSKAEIAFQVKDIANKLGAIKLAIALPNEELVILSAIKVALVEGKISVIRGMLAT